MKYMYVSKKIAKKWLCIRTLLLIKNTTKAKQKHQQKSCFLTMQYYCKTQFCKFNLALFAIYSKTCVKQPLSKDKRGFSRPIIA